jgi:hypothetical protein
MQEAIRGRGNLSDLRQNSGVKFQSSPRIAASLEMYCTPTSTEIKVSIPQPAG